MDEQTNSEQEPLQEEIGNTPPENGKVKVKRSLTRKIINAFILIILILFTISLILLGFTQTKTFRDYLREKVIALANSELNGKLNIEKIDGTFFTSIYLRNTSIVLDNDTLLTAANIEIKTSPMQLLLKKIYVRNIVLEKLKVNLLQDKNGDWNYKKLLKPTPEDTSKSTFSFLIQAPDIKLKNISLTYQTYQNLRSQAVYKNINYNDLRINDLNFNAQVYADIENSDYLLILNELSFKPNLTRFNLRYISGEFAVTKKFASVKNFYFLTDSSEISISARIDSLNLLGNVELEDFKNYPVTIDAKASPFNFDDLSSFFNSTEVLKGDPSFHLKAHGKFGSFKLDKGIVDFKDTHFELSGQVLNLNKPSKLYLKASVTNTDFDYKDVNLLMPSLQLPEYAKMVLKGVNIEYEGEPTNFKTKFLGNVDDGFVSGEGSMNVAVTPITYDLKFETSNLNLFALSGINTKLTSKGSLVGKGTSPHDILASIKFNAVNSSIEEIEIDRFDLTSQAGDRKFSLNISSQAEGATSIVQGDVIFDADTIPSYSIIGDIKNINLAKFIKGDQYQSNMNFYFGLEGKSFDPDEINATLSFGIDSSYFQDKWINSSIVETKLKKDSNGREIFLSSDFVDFKINGSFSLKKAIELIAYESKTISNIVTKKISELNPLSVVDQEIKDDSLDIQSSPIVNSDISFDFDFKFKDFELIAMLMENEKLDITGFGNGNISNKGNNFSLSTELNLDYMVMMNKGRTIYLSDFVADFNFTRDNRFNSFDKLFGSASLTGKRLYFGSNVKAINADVTFNQSKLFYNASVNYDDLINAEVEGIILMTPIEQQFRISNLDVKYQGLSWTNRDTIKAFFNPNYFKIAQCNIAHDSSVVSLSGIIEASGSQDIDINANKISGEVIEKYLFGFSESHLLATGSLASKINGKFDNPKMQIDFALDNLQYDVSKLGNLKGSLNYSEKNLLMDFVFLDSLSNKSKPLIVLNGNLPIDLSFATVNQRILEDKPVNMLLRSNNFNVSQLGRIIPTIIDQSGVIKGNVEISGTFNKPLYTGYLSLTDGLFRFKFNNLLYKCGAKLSFEDKGIVVDSMIVSNFDDTKFPGTINGKGSVTFEGFKIKDLGLRFFGDISIMGQRTKAVSPLFYGDLLIGSNGDWTFNKRGDRYLFKGDIELKQTDLVYTTGQDYSSGTNKNIDFEFVVDSSKIDKEQIKFQKLVAQNKNDISGKQNGFDFNLDYDLKISSQNRNKATFILSQLSLNQKLFVEMKGNLIFQNYNDKIFSQGAFELLSGSRLEFFKTFDATGFLRFESDITNPYLDIVSTYKADYINPRDPEGTSEEVAVKIKINASLSDLAKTLASSQDALSIYIGARNIQNNVKESRYDYADALSFILIGKFKDDLTAQDKAQVAGQTQNAFNSTATSFLGSILSSYINSAVGDLVNNISIDQTARDTKFSLSGRIQNFSYKLGGTQEVFQDIGKANIGLYLNLFSTRFLLRFERKDPLINYGVYDKINELALKYKFEF